jgi:hypothetical protein
VLVDYAIQSSMYPHRILVESSLSTYFHLNSRHVSVTKGHRQVCIIGFEVLTAVVMKSSIFWVITPCSPLKVNRRFEGTCPFYLQGRRISQRRK